MLDVEKQRTFIRIAAAAAPGVSTRSLAEAAGFSGSYGGRLLKRHAKAIERRRRNIANLEKGHAKRRYKPGTGEQMHLLQERRDLHLVDPAFAMRQWYLARDSYLDVELRWRDPAQMDALQARRELSKARLDYERTTETVVRVHEAHGAPVPSDLLAKPERSRTEGTATPKTIDDVDVVVAGASPGGDPEPCRLHPSQPAKGCPLCPMAPTRCPRHGLVYEQVIIHGPRGPVGQRTACPDCEPGSTTIYATARSQQLAWSAPERVLASTGPGRAASSFAPRNYGHDPFKDF